VLLTQAEATEAKVRRQRLSDFDSILFATHGLIKNDLEGLAEPALALTPVAASQSHDDGLLTAAEIAGLALNARIVALSACNTANFDLSLFGSQVQSLAAAFWVAGTRSLLASLWPVESETSRILTVNFYQRIAKGKAADDALFEARKALLATRPERAYQHPRFWAPFILQGDGAMRMAQR